MASNVVEQNGAEPAVNALAVLGNGGPRKVVKWSMPAPASAIVGQPRWSGLSALVGAERRSDVWSLLLRRALSISTTEREVLR